MKKLMISSLFAVLFLSTALAQYRTVRTGYEGDFFSLEGALDLFKQSYTLRDFERKLNTEDNWVNNLDLNYDGRIDYIRVEHLRNGRNYHAIVLQALLGRYDIQDVAVIEIEILGRGEAVLQIIGDEDLYGEEVIVEPVEGYTDSRSGYHPNYGGFVNVYYWEPVQYILGRQYQVYVSPYRWQYYPVWWRPWVQCSWSVFHPRVVVYVHNYHVVHTHRVVRVHNYYRNYRSYSYDVVQRTNEVRVRHGRRPVHRPKPDRYNNGRLGEHRSRKDFEQGAGNGLGRQQQSPATSSRRTLDPTVESRSRNTTDNPGSNEKSPSVSSRRTLPPTVDRGTRNTNGSPGSADVTEKHRSVNPTHNSTVRNRKTVPSSDQPTIRRTPDRKTRSSVDHSATTRSTAPVQKSTVRSRKPTTYTGQNKTRSTTPKVSQKSRTTTTRSKATTRSSASVRKPSASSRTAPAVKSKASKKSSPKVNQPSRSKSASKTSYRKPAASSKRSAPAKKQKTAVGGSSKRSSSKSGSRKR